MTGMASKREGAIEQARGVLRFWAQRIGQPTALDAAPHQKAGTEPAAFSVTTDRGARFVLKNIAGKMNAERIETEHHLLQHLRTHGVPVAVPIPTDGGRLCAREEGGVYVLYPMLPTDGRIPPEGIGSVYAHIGAAVARLHRALAAYPGHIDSWTMDLPRTVYAEAVPRIERALATEQRERFLPVIAALESKLTSALTGLPTQRIHGDCHGGNYVLYRGDVSGFIDLDHLPTGPRVYDLGYLLADMAKAPFVGGDAHTDWLRHFERVIKGYDQESPLSAREWRAIWYVMLATQVLFVDWFLEHNQIELAQKNLDAFYWIHQQRDAITRLDGPAQSLDRPVDDPALTLSAPSRWTCGSTGPSMTGAKNRR